MVARHGCEDDERDQRPVGEYRPVLDEADALVYVGELQSRHDPKHEDDEPKYVLHAELGMGTTQTLTPRPRRQTANKRRPV